MFTAIYNGEILSPSDFILEKYHLLRKRVRRESAGCWSSPTCTRWPHQHGNGLHEQDQADGAGELLGAHYGHQNLELQRPHHAVGDPKEDAEDHQSGVVPGLACKRNQG